MKIDLNELRQRKKYINEVNHPTLPLIIWNYSNACQFDNAWDDYTRMTRGLITDTEGNIVARPFQKFFNLNTFEETKIENLPAEVPAIYEKLDGSLGILYWVNDIPHIATRGSFTSDQAKWATEWLHERYTTEDYPFNRDYTYLFEIIYPSNRIVVDYGKKEELVLLAVINTETGEEIDHVKEANRLYFKYATPIQQPLEELVSYLPTLDGNIEGYVVKYPNNFRVKMKGDEYVRLHRLITGFSNKSIWELMMNGTDLDELLDRVPDEFYEWVKRVQRDLIFASDQLIEATYDAWAEVKDLETRKDQALYLKDNHPQLMSLVFGILDERDIKKDIWKRLKPTYSKPFKIEID